MNPLKTFIIYAHEDSQYRKSLIDFLSHLEKKQKISIWTDQEILPGEAWDEKITSNLAQADLILPIISVDFYNSNYIQEKEFKSAVSRFNAGEALLVPILARVCPWKKYDMIGDLQVLPTGSQAIDIWSDKNQAYTDIAEKLEDMIDRHRQRMLEIEQMRLREEKRKAELAVEEEKRTRILEQKKYEEEKRRQLEEMEKSRTETIEERRQRHEIQASMIELKRQRRRSRLFSVIACSLLVVAGLLAIINYKRNQDLDKTNNALTAKTGSSSARWTATRDSLEQFVKKFDKERSEYHKMVKLIYQMAYEHYKEDAKKHPNQSEKQMMRANEFLKQLGFDRRDRPEDIEAVIIDPAKAKRLNK
jgi:TIR domain